MIIHCQQCDTGFEVDGALMATKGRYFQCARCAHVWYEEGAAQTGVNSQKATKLSQQQVIDVSTSHYFYRKWFAIFFVIITAAAIGSGLAWLVREKFPHFLERTATTPSAPLMIENLSAAFTDREGQQVLIIKGEIVNQTKKAQNVPDLSILIYDEANNIVQRQKALPPRRTLFPQTQKDFTLQVSAPVQSAVRADVVFKEQ